MFARESVDAPLLLTSPHPTHIRHTETVQLSCFTSFVISECGAKISVSIDNAETIGRKKEQTAEKATNNLSERMSQTKSLYLCGQKVR